ncbi:unnamed protein product [Nezara viridula]|uniref:Transposase n=2 Tax=Nezara viridula TaxID=85310 RepID=A0A9P0EA30_NEZVI|nr:unnamed protein product [Nezara viridula]
MEYSDSSCSLGSGFNTTNLGVAVSQFFIPVPQKCSPTKIVALCVKCLPTAVEIKGYGKSSSNFLSHLKRKHGETALEEYRRITEGKRFKENSNDGREIGMPILPRNKKQPSQLEFEINILKFLSHTQVPLKTVDNPYFIKIFEHLDISRKGLSLISYNDVVKKMETLVQNNKNFLKLTFKNLNYVCTTLDIWSGIQNFVLGITAHWIKEDLDRGSAAIAYRKFQRSLSVERISQLITEIHNDYGLSHAKIVATMMDNKNDFSKALEDFGVNKKFIVTNESVVSDDSESESDSEFQSDTKIRLCSSIINELSSLFTYSFRCCIHELNLCVANDVLNVIKEFETLYNVHNQVISKCNALWQVASSSNAADAIQNILGNSLSVPQEGSWNSFYDALKSILSNKGKYQQFYDILSIENTLTECDFEYIDEFLTCTRPFTEAIEILQSKRHSYYGVVLPLLFALRPKLERLSNNNWIYCKPISQCLLTSVNKRFEHFYNFTTEESLNAAIASVTHPEFKNRWFCQVKSENQKKILQTLKEIVAAEINLAQDSLQSTSNEQSVSDFFDFGENTIAEQSSELKINQFLSDPNRKIEMLHKYPEIKEIFIKYNTPIPSSAPVQQLCSFSTMKSLTRSHNLDRKRFETRILLKDMDSWESRLHGDRQWEGEDSNQAGAVKDSWDQDSDTEEVKPPPLLPQAPPKASSTKKSIKKICKEYDEKEKREEEERQARRQRLREELTVGANSDRLRRRKLQEAADLSLAKEVLGLVCPKSVKDDSIQT